LATQRHARLPRLDAALSLVEARQAYAAYFLRQCGEQLSIQITAMTASRFIMSLYGLRR